MNLDESLSKIDNKNYQIEIFGLGYVGFPLSIVLASSGVKVIGIDVDDKKLGRFKKGSLLELEKNFRKDFNIVTKNGNLNFEKTLRFSKKTKIGIICVPTPISKNLAKSNSNVKSAVKNFLNYCKKGDSIIIESSIGVGTTDLIKKMIEKKGYQVGIDLGLSYCPERIDPQNKKWDLNNIPRVIFCSDDISFNIAKEIYRFVNKANLIRVSSPKVAEVVKSFENTFRLTNISLVNELAILCEKLGINVTEVIKAASSKPFGFLPFYTGAGAGGHCIPKDPIFLANSSNNYGFKFNMIETAVKINQIVPKHIVNKINEILTKNKLEKSVIVCGLSYKTDMIDMRDSPGFKILNQLKKRKIFSVGFDPFFESDLLEKYLDENNMKNTKIKTIKNLDNKTISNFSCLCIVQHHSKIKNRINEIYEKSLIPVIYDCQNKIKKKNNSRSILQSFGCTSKT
jgi:UDP-N-acetyl-D-glucosamine dehydrogenase